MIIVKVPMINGLGKTKGCEFGGKKVLDSLDEIYSNEQGKIIDIKNLELEEIHLDNYNLELSNDLIYKNSYNLLETQDKVIFLGGDHSISYSTTKAFLDFMKKEKKEPCLIVFDAHADCMKPIKEPTHEEWLRAVIEAGFPSKNVLLVGARNLDEEELNFIKKEKIRVVSMNQLNEDIQDTCDLIMEFSQGKELYLSVDIDVVDPAFASGTGYLEPGGLSSRQIIFLVQRLNKLRNLKAIDIVEINPEKDFKNLTTKLGAKILSEII